MIKGVVATVESVLMCFWGINFITIIKMYDFPDLISSTEGVFRLIFLIVGTIILSIRAHHIYHNNHIDRERKRIENKKLMRDYEKSIKEDL